MRHERRTIMKWFKWGTVALGVALCLAPFVFGYSGELAGLAMSLATGGVIALFGGFEEYKTAAVAGLLAAVSPLLLGGRLVSGTATWSLVLLGAATAVLAGYQGFFAKPGSDANGSQSQGA
jgi:ABC-type glycerol-3-phosphate transport system permease component